MAKKIKKVRKIKKVKEYKEGKLVVVAPWKGKVLRNLIIGITFLVLTVAMLFFMRIGNFLIGLVWIMLFTVSLMISSFLLVKSRLKVFDDRIELPMNKLSLRNDLALIFYGEIERVEILKLSENDKVPVFFLKNAPSVRMSRGDYVEEGVLALMNETLKNAGIVPTVRDLSKHSNADKRKMLRSHTTIVRRSV